MEEEKISVIVPVFNVENYLKKCIESILKQTYCDFELLMVNDGSTDRSGDICEEYRQRDSRIKVFHKENAGVSAARNTGLENCTAKYVTFVDSDDYVMPNYLEKLYDNMKKYDVDISICNFSIFDEEGMFSKHSLCKSKRVFCDDRIDYCRYSFLNYACGKLFKKQIIGNLRFDTGLLVSEDTFFVAQVLKKTRQFYFDCQALYVYRMQGFSIVHTLDFKKLKTSLTAWDRISKLHAPESKAYWSAKFCYLQTYRKILNMDKNQLSIFQKDLRRYFPSFWKADAELKEKALLLLLMFFPTVYFMIYRKYKSSSNEKTRLKAEE